MSVVLEPLIIYNDRDSTIELARAAYMAGFRQYVLQKMENNNAVAVLWFHAKFGLITFDNIEHLKSLGVSVHRPEYHEEDRANRTRFVYLSAEDLTMVKLVSTATNKFTGKYAGDSILHQSNPILIEKEWLV